MSKLHKAAAAIGHILIVSIGLHAYSFVTSDRMIDAATDVALDKVTTIALHAFKMGAE
jgi:hypothetical protein